MFGNVNTAVTMVLVSVLRSSAFGASFVDSDVCVKFDALKKRRIKILNNLIEGVSVI